MKYRICQFLWPAKVGQKCSLKIRIYQHSLSIWLLCFGFFKKEQWYFLIEKYVFNNSVLCYRSSTQMQRELCKNSWFMFLPWNRFFFLQQTCWLSVVSDKQYKNQSYLKMNMKNEICIDGRKMNRAKIYSDDLLKQK